MHFHIEVEGCDDSTEVVTGLTAKELATVERIAELITRGSHFGCMPRMTVRPATEAEIAGEVS